MPAVVVFLIFVICLIIAIPVSISLGIVSVLPGAVDPSFTASGTYVIRSMLGGIDNQDNYDSLMKQIQSVIDADNKDK